MPVFVGIFPGQTINTIDVVTRQDDVNNPIEPTLTQTFSLYGITAFEVQYWTGSAWVTVPNGSVTGNNKVWRQFTFTPITTNKIRVVVNAGADNVFSRVVEVAAWGETAATAKINWLVTDQLGTPRMVLDKSGSLANVKRHDYLPFGEELTTQGLRSTLPSYVPADGVRQKFTSKERDVETGLDYFEARYFGSLQGRFTTVDPVGLKLARLIDPQQINRYAFVRNNPLKYVDPDGRDLKLAPGLKPADVDTIIKGTVKLYRKESGRKALEAMEKSSPEILVGTGKLPSKTNLMEGVVNDQFGVTKAARDVNIDPKSGQVVAAKVAWITVTFDFAKRNDVAHEAETNRSAQPESEQTVIEHEYGHVDRVLTDPLGSISDKDPEKPAQDFVKQADGEKNSMTKEAAEKRVREMFGLPPKEEKKKKD